MLSFHRILELSREVEVGAIGGSGPRILRRSTVRIPSRAIKNEIQRHLDVQSLADAMKSLTSANYYN